MKNTFNHIQTRQNNPLATPQPLKNKQTHPNTLKTTPLQPYNPQTLTEICRVMIGRALKTHGREEGDEASDSASVDTLAVSEGV